MKETNLRKYMRENPNLKMVYDGPLGFEFVAHSLDEAKKLVCKIDSIELKKPFRILFDTSNDNLEVVTTEASIASINIHRFNSISIK